jgi:hypothetical protein
VKARVEDVVVGPLDDIDAVELDESEALNLPEGIGGRDGARGMVEQSLRLQEERASGL